MDQANKLRKIMESINDKNKISLDRKLIEKKARVISISSGKGGVGKTNFAINLSIALSRKGYKVVILDADIGLGNVEILTGCNISGNISEVILEGKGIDQLISEGPEGVKFIAGGSGLRELALINRSNIELIFKELSKLQAMFDYVLIDTGAGISNTVLDFALSTNQIIVVSTPEPTSIMDAYILIKSLYLKKYSGQIRLVTNMVKNAKEAFETYERINSVAYEFLEINIDYLGYISKDEIVSKSVREQVPFLINYPNKRVSNQVENIAENLINNIHKEYEEENFASKLINFFLSR